MPYVHIDLPSAYPIDIKRNLAAQIGGIYAAVMQTTADLVNVTFRELGEGNVWSCNGEPPVKAAIISIESRRGRPAEQREELCRKLMAAITLALDLDPTTTAVEMTQHAGDENYLERYVDGKLYGCLGRDWSAEETTQSLCDRLANEARGAKEA